MISPTGAVYERQREAQSKANLHKAGGDEECATSEIAKGGALARVGVKVAGREL